MVRFVNIFCNAMAAIVTIAGLTVVQPAKAQGPCDHLWTDNPSPPSIRSRRIRLTDHRISFEIPENYRTIRKSDLIYILPEALYQFHQCEIVNGIATSPWYHDIRIEINPNNWTSMSQFRRSVMRSSYYQNPNSGTDILVNQLRMMRIHYFDNDSAGEDYGPRMTYVAEAPCRCRTIAVSAGVKAYATPYSAREFWGILHSLQFF